MEWPAHQLLRQQQQQQCEKPEDVETGSTVTSTCSTRGEGGRQRFLDKCSSFGSSCFSCSTGANIRISDAGSEPPPSPSKPPPAHKPRGKGKWRKKCVDYSRLDGWYVLAAETLGTIILIALCVVAANQARSMSDEVDTVALAALARSNPRAICVNASTENVQGRIIQGVNLQLVPSSFRDTSGRHWKRVGLEVGMRAPTGLWNLPISSQSIPIDSVFTQSMFASMYKCGIIKGAYHSQDLPAFISRGCSQCRIELGASLNGSAPINVTLAPTDDINTARAHPALEKKSVQYRLAQVSNTSLATEQLSQLLLSSSFPAAAAAAATAAAGHPDPIGGLHWANETGNLLMFAQDEFLPGLDAIPHALEAPSGESTREYLIMLNPGLPTFAGMDTSLYMTEEMWHTADYNSHHRHLDPRAVPVGTLRVDVFHSPPLSFLEGGKSVKGQHVSSIWLELNQQNARTAQCMAESASLAVSLLQQARYSLRQPNGSVLHSVRPRDYNVTFDQLWLRLDANLDAARPYACAEGVDVTSSDATAYLTRLQAYKSTAKSQYRTTIFMSMHHQTAEDIYAVYTGALGAVFGSMALLVASLFVIVIAAVQHAVTGRDDHTS